MAEDLPPVTFGVKVTAQNPAHVYLDLFAGRNPAARGLAGGLTLRVEEFEEFVRRLAPEVVVMPSTDQCSIHTWRCRSCVCVLTAGHPGLCDVHCQGSPGVRDGG